jgi:O-antigen/teichoic acid export membrane protein
LSNIRITYSGLISLLIRFFSIFTGLAFTLIVTRQLTPEEFGTWGLISGVIIYATIINPIINYWSTREIARGDDSGKTALSASSIFSAAGIFIYIIIAYFVGLQSNADLDVLLLASILVPVIFINDSLSAINAGWKPHVVSYGFLGFEIIKIPAGLTLVYFLQLGIEGAIYASFIAYLASIIVQIIFAKEKLKVNFNFKYIKKWTKLFWLPVYRGLPSLLSLSDVVIFSIITGSVIGVAYYTAAKTIGFLVNNTRSFTIGLYPKLLESGKKEYLQETIIQLLFFAFPLVAFSIVIAKPALFVLNPVYGIAVPVVVILSIRSLITTLNLTFFQALQGIEEIDINKKSTFRDYIKSKLILLPTFQLIRNVVYIGLLALMLFFIDFNKEDQIQIVIYWSLIGLIIEIPIFIYILNLVKRNFVLKLEKLTLIKYAFASFVSFGLMYILMDKYLQYENKIFEFLPNLMIYIAIGVGSYLIITYFIDNRTRILVKAIISELLPK